jgi:hypothetical protein
MSFSTSCLNPNKKGTMWIDNIPFPVINPDSLIVSVFHGEKISNPMGKVSIDLSSKSAGFSGITLKVPDNFKASDFDWAECARTVHYNDGKCLYTMTTSSSMEEQFMPAKGEVELSVISGDSYLDTPTGRWRGITETFI